MRPHPFEIVLWWKLNFVIAAIVNIPEFIFGNQKLERLCVVDGFSDLENHVKVRPFQVEFLKAGVFVVFIKREEFLFKVSVADEVERFLVHRSIGKFIN